MRGDKGEGDARFIASSRILIPDLATALRSLADQVEARDKRVAELEAALRGELSTAQSMRILAAKKEADRG